MCVCILLIAVVGASVTMGMPYIVYIMLDNYFSHVL